MAIDAAIRLNATVADVPISAYQCRFCTGFHLTSAAWEAENSLNLVDFVVPLVSIDEPQTWGAVLGIDRCFSQKSAVKRKKRKKYHNGLQDKARREDQHEALVSRIVEAPAVATPDEIDAFFAAHAKSA